MKKLLLLMLALVLCLAVFAACVGGNEEESTSGTSTDDPVVDSGLEAAVEYVHQLYKDIAEKTGGNYTLITKLEIEGVNYTIEWTVSSDKIEVIPTEGKDEVTISVPQNATEDIPYTLTATVKSPDGKTAQKSYDHIVPKFQYSSFADYVAAEEGDAVVISGIVTGIVSKETGSQINGLYIQDTNNDGGYYVYGVTTGFEGVQVGMTVEARGTKDDYNGTLEVKDAAITILDETINPATPVDFTEIIASADSLSDTALVGKQGMLVTIKGVTVLEVGDNGYYYFQAGEHKVYLRISGSNNPCTTADLDAVKAAHAANFGNIGDVTGVISIYSGNFYLSPVSAEAFNNFTVVEKTPEEKIAMEKDALTFTAKVSKDTVLELASKGQFFDDVTITWTSDNTAAVVGENGLTVTLGKEAVTAKITATITCGEASATVEFTLQIAAKPTSYPVAIDTPIAGNAYKIYMIHPNAEKNGIACYLTGKEGNKEYYLATTEDYTEAADIYAEATEGGYHLYLMDGGKKVYLNIRANGNYVNNLYEETAQCVYTWDATLKTFVTVVNDNTYSFGMKKTSTYTTVEAKKITDDVNAFAQFVTMVEPGPQIPVTLTTGTAYQIYMVHPNADKNGIACYLTGEQGNKEYYLATSESILDAAAFYLEEVEGGYAVYFMKGEKKVYLNIRANGNYVNNLYEETAQCVYTYDANLKTLVTTVNDSVYTFGMKTKSTYTTIEAKKISAEDCSFANFVVWVGPLPENSNNDNNDQPSENTAVIDFSNVANRTSFSENAQVWVANGITFTNEQAASTAPVADFTAPVRCYKSTSIKIEYTGMKKIVFNCNSIKGTSGLEGITVEGATFSIEGNTVTVTFATAVNSFFVESLASQIRFDSIEVYVD